MLLASKCAVARRPSSLLQSRDWGVQAPMTAPVARAQADSDYNAILAKSNLPEQGFEGKDVEHKNMDTYTEDFGKEYGPNSGQNKGKKKQEEPVRYSGAQSQSLTALVGLGLIVGRLLI